MCSFCMKRRARNWPKLPNPTMPILSFLRRFAARASLSKGMAASRALTEKRALDRAGVDARRGTRDAPARQPSRAESERQLSARDDPVSNRALVPVAEARRVETADALGQTRARAGTLEATCADMRACVAEMSERVGGRAVVSVWRRTRIIVESSVAFFPRPCARMNSPVTGAAELGGDVVLGAPSRVPEAFARGVHLLPTVGRRLRVSPPHVARDAGRPASNRRTWPEGGEDVVLRRTRRP